jgi:hypothetical protein
MEFNQQLVHAEVLETKGKKTPKNPYVQMIMCAF